MSGYTANITGIQNEFMKALRKPKDWMENYPSEVEAINNLHELAVAYFDDLDLNGTIQEYKLTITPVYRNDDTGFMVEGACVFPESCVTDILTFRTIIRT